MQAITAVATCQYGNLNGKHRVTREADLFINMHLFYTCILLFSLMAALLISFPAAFKISWRTTKPHGTFLLPGLHTEYGHTILCGTTAAAHLELTSQKCTNTGEGHDKCGIHPKLTNGSCVDKALKFA